MAVLKKLEYFVSSTSENTSADAIDKIKAELNRKQALASNKTAGGEFKNLYFAGFFDPRELKQYLIFSNETKTSGGLSDTLYDLSASITDEKLVELFQGSEALKNEIKTYVDSAIEEAINGDLVSMEFIQTL